MSAARGIAPHHWWQQQESAGRIPKGQIKACSWETTGGGDPTEEYPWSCDSRCSDPLLSGVDNWVRP